MCFFLAFSFFNFSFCFADGNSYYKQWDEVLFDGCNSYTTLLFHWNGVVGCKFSNCSYLYGVRQGTFMHPHLIFRAYCTHCCIYSWSLSPPPPPSSLLGSMINVSAEVSLQSLIKCQYKLLLQEHPERQWKHKSFGKVKEIQYSVKKRKNSLEKFHACSLYMPMEMV